MKKLMTRAVAGVGAAVAAMTIAAGPAAAHAALAGSTPVNGSTIDVAPEQVTLTFNEDIKQEFHALSVLGPDGAQWGQGEPRAAGRDLTVDLAGLGNPGEYTIGFRVVSADGHPIQGTIAFEFAAPGIDRRAASIRGRSVRECRCLRLGAVGRRR